MSRPKANEYNSFFQGYITMVTGQSLEEIVNNHNQNILEYWDTIPNEKWSYSYAPNKWTVKQVLQHIIDTERILAYRALCIVRGEKQKLNEFDEKKYADSGDAIFRNINDLISEWKLLRESNNFMFKSFTENDLNKAGVVGSKNLSVKAIIYIVFGHVLHHMNIVNNKYLISSKPYNIL
ncbi:MAG TPA: DinB family protein [Flavobacteriales bacterium]|jgi:uncharacterized damage-inducible protein DinB|nr:DinB family protein [Flavobacteriales bacterium]|tara:strand:- start:1382 stop:1918 length:537 start_codon:yes stop_codon:yes gene_type:complete